MRLILLTLLGLSLSGCFWNTKPIEITSKPIEKIPLVVPEVDRYYHRPVEWIVVTPENVEEVFAELRAKGKSVALFALTNNGYEALALNMGDITKLIKQKNIVIEAYKDYYIAVEKRDSPKK